MKNNNLKLIYEGLAGKNPQLKERGFEAFRADMQNEDNLRQIFDGMTVKNPILKERGFDAFKTDMFPEPVAESPEMGEAQKKYPRWLDKYVENTNNIQGESKTDTNIDDSKQLEIKRQIDEINRKYLSKPNQSELFNNDEWNEKPNSEKFSTGVKAGWENLKGGLKYTGAVIGEGLDKLDGEDDWQFDNRMFDAARKNFESAPQGKGILYDVGNFVPQMVGIAAATVSAPLTGGTSLAALPTVIGGANIAMLTASAAGSAMNEYDRYKGEDSNDLARIGVGIGAGAAEYIAERIGLGRYVPKGALVRPMARFLTKNERIAKELAEKGIKRNPKVKEFLVKTGKNMLGEGGEESLTESGNILIETLYKDKEDRADWNEITSRLGSAFRGGALMGGVLSPVSYGSEVAYHNKMVDLNGSNNQAQPQAPVNPEQQPPTVGPQQQVDAMRNQFLQESEQQADLFQHENGSFIQVTDKSGKRYFVTKGELESKDGLLFAINEQGEEVQLSNTDIAQSEVIPGREDYIAQRMEAFESQVQQVNENSVTIDGQRYLIHGEVVPGEIALQPIDELGNPTSENITSLPVEEFANLTQNTNEVAEPITAERGVETPTEQQETIQPPIDAAQETPIVQQKLGKNTFDIIEREGYDEIVPTDKMPLEKALPILQERFKSNPGYNVVPQKVQVSIPPKTKYDEPGKEIRLKAIHIVPVGQKKSKYDENPIEEKKGSTNETPTSDASTLDFTPSDSKGTEDIKNKQLSDEANGILKNETVDRPAVSNGTDQAVSSGTSAPGTKNYSNAQVANDFEESLEMPAEEVRKLFEQDEPASKIEDKSKKPNKYFDDQVEPNPNLKPQDEVYELIKDKWFAKKDEEVVLSNIDTRRFQQRIKDTFAAGNKQGARNWREIDKAIHVYLDVREKPDQIEKYWDELSDTQKRLVNIAINLSPEQKAIAQEIRRLYDEIGQRAMDAEIIHNVLDNYVSRTWDTRGKETDEFFTNFSTETGHAKLRTLGSILEGWAKGYDLMTEGATNNLDNLRTELTNVIENRKLINLGLTMETTEGLPLLSTDAIPGYKPIEHPNFNKWRKVKKVNTYKEYKGENFVITKDGVVFERKKLYAPPKIAKNLNNILNKSSLSQRLPGVGAITRINAQLKATILSWSFFHHMAFTRSYLLGSALGWNIKNWTPIGAYKEGLKLLDSKNPEVIHLVRNGLTLGRNQEWDESAIERKSKISKWLDEMNVAPGVSEKIYSLHKNHTDFLFNKYGTGLKVKSALLEYHHLLKKYPDKNPDYLAKLVAKQTNADFGGLHLERMGRNQNWQHFMRLTLLAPDWTESNVQTMVKAIAAKDKTERAMYRRFWKRAFLRTAFTSVALNLALALSSLWDGDDEDYWEAVAGIYKKAFEDPERLNWLSVDITPFYKKFFEPDGESEEAVEKYFSVLGHFYDPVKFILAPFQSLKNKGSVLTKTAFEALTGENWQGKRFTTLGELTGTDDKGHYKTSSKKHGYRVGDPKGGKHKGQLTRWRRSGDYGPLKYEEIPSFLLNTIRGSVPIPLQNGLAFALGEISAFDALSHGVGIHMKSKRSNNSLNKEYQAAIEAAILYDRMIKDRMRHGEKKEFDKLMADSEKVKQSQILVRYDKQVQLLREVLLRHEEAGDEKGIEAVQKALDEIMKQAIETSKKQ